MPFENTFGVTTSDRATTGGAHTEQPVTDVLGPSTVRWGAKKESYPDQLVFADTSAAKKSEQAPSPERNFLSLLGGQSAETREALKNIEHLSITRDRNNPQSFHIDGNLNKPVNLPPPNLEVGGLGPFGKISATPTGTTLQKFDFNLSSTDHSVHISDVHGFNGQADVTRHGRFRDRELKPRATNTRGFDLDAGSDPPKLLIHDAQRTVCAGAANFDAQSAMGKLLSDKSTRETVLNGLQEVEKRLDKIDLRQTTPGVLEGSINIHGEIPVNQQMPGIFGAKGPLVTNLQVKDEKGMQVKMDLNTGKLELTGNMEVGIKIGELMETKVPISKVTREIGKDGKPAFHVEYAQPK